jgi:hypothetical protein
VDLGLDEVGFHPELLVIELLELNKQVVDESEGFAVLLLFVEDEGQLGLNALAEEGPLLGLAPLDDVLANLGLLLLSADTGERLRVWSKRTFAV